MIYKAMFDALSPTWQAYGRAVFIETDGDEAERAQLAHAAAQSDYPQSEIRMVAIGASTAAARDAFHARKAAERRWMENNRRGIANHRSDLEPTQSHVAGEAGEQERTE